MVMKAKMACIFSLKYCTAKTKDPRKGTYFEKEYLKYEDMILEYIKRRISSELFKELFSFEELNTLAKELSNLECDSLKFRESLLIMQCNIPEIWFKINPAIFKRTNKRFMQCSGKTFAVILVIMLQTLNILNFQGKKIENDLIYFIHSKFRLRAVLLCKYLYDSRVLLSYQMFYHTISTVLLFSMTFIQSCIKKFCILRWSKKVGKFTYGRCKLPLKYDHFEDFSKKSSEPVKKNDMIHKVVYMDNFVLIDVMNGDSKYMKHSLQSQSNHDSNSKLADGRILLSYEVDSRLFIQVEYCASMIKCKTDIYSRDAEYSIICCNVGFKTFYHTNDWRWAVPEVSQRNDDSKWLHDEMDLSSRFNRKHEIVYKSTLLNHIDRLLNLRDVEYFIDVLDGSSKASYIGDRAISVGVQEKFVNEDRDSNEVNSFSRNFPDGGDDGDSGDSSDGDDSSGDSPDGNDGGSGDSPDGDDGGSGDSPDGDDGGYGDSPDGDDGGSGDSPDGDDGGSGDSPDGDDGGSGDSPDGDDGGSGDSPDGDDGGSGDSPDGDDGGYGDSPDGDDGGYGDSPDGDDGGYGDSPDGDDGGSGDSPDGDDGGSGDSPDGNDGGSGDSPDGDDGGSGDSPDDDGGSGDSPDDDGGSGDSPDDDGGSGDSPDGDDGGSGDSPDGDDGGSGDSPDGDDGGSGDSPDGNDGGSGDSPDGDDGGSGDSPDDDGGSGDSPDDDGGSGDSSDGNDGGSGDSPDGDDDGSGDSSDSDDDGSGDSSYGDDGGSGDSSDGYDNGFGDSSDDNSGNSSNDDGGSGDYPDGDDGGSPDSPDGDEGSGNSTDSEDSGSGDSSGWEKGISADSSDNHDEKYGEFHGNFGSRGSYGDKNNSEDYLGKDGGSDNSNDDSVECHQCSESKFNDDYNCNRSENSPNRRNMSKGSGCAVKDRNEDPNKSLSLEKSDDCQGNFLHSCKDDREDDYINYRDDNCPEILVPDSTSIAKDVDHQSSIKGQKYCRKYQIMNDVHELSLLDKEVLPKNRVVGTKLLRVSKGKKFENAFEENQCQCYGTSSSTDFTCMYLLNSQDTFPLGRFETLYDPLGTLGDSYLELNEKSCPSASMARLLKANNFDLNNNKYLKSKYICDAFREIWNLKESKNGSPIEQSSKKNRIFEEIDTSRLSGMHKEIVEKITENDVPSNQPPIMEVNDFIHHLTPQTLKDIELMAKFSNSNHIRFPDFEFQSNVVDMEAELLVNQGIEKERIKSKANSKQKAAKKQTKAGTREVKGRKLGKPLFIPSGEEEDSLFERDDSPPPNNFGSLIDADRNPIFDLVYLKTICAMCHNVYNSRRKPYIRICGETVCEKCNRLPHCSLCNGNVSFQNKEILYNTSLILNSFINLKLLNHSEILELKSSVNQENLITIALNELDNYFPMQGDESTADKKEYKELDLVRAFQQLTFSTSVISDARFSAECGTAEVSMAVTKLEGLMNASIEFTRLIDQNIVNVFAQLESNNLISGGIRVTELAVLSVLNLNGSSDLNVFTCLNTRSGTKYGAVKTFGDLIFIDSFSKYIPKLLKNVVMFDYISFQRRHFRVGAMLSFKPRNGIPDSPTYKVLFLISDKAWVLDEQFKALCSNEGEASYIGGTAVVANKRIYIQSFVQDGKQCYDSYYHNVPDFIGVFKAPTKGTVFTLPKLGAAGQVAIALTEEKEKQWCVGQCIKDTLSENIVNGEYDITECSVIWFSDKFSLTVRSKDDLFAKFT